MSCNPEYLIIQHLLNPVGARLKELKYTYIWLCVRVCVCVCVCARARTHACVLWGRERENDMTAHIRDLQCGTRISNIAIILNIKYTGFTETKGLRTVIKSSMRESRTALHIAVAVKSITV